MVKNTEFNKFALSFKRLDKKAQGNGLSYMANEFEELQNDVNDYISSYRSTYSQNKNKVIVDVDTMNIIGRGLDRFKDVLHKYWSESNVLFSNFKKMIVKNHFNEIVNNFGEDYITEINKLFPGKDLSAKYKILIELVRFDQKSVLEEALFSLSNGPMIYGEFYQKINSFYEANKDGKNKYEWVNNYVDLFKFAAAEGIDDEEIELGDEDIEFVDITLNTKELNLLETIIQRWELNKDYLDKFMNLLERAYLVAKGTAENSNEQADTLEGLFDRIRAIKYMVNSYMKEGGSEKTFYEATSLSFRNAKLQIDNMVYLLTTTMPGQISSYIHKHYINKLPKQKEKVDPKMFDIEENFFNRGKDYEEGNLSGITEDDGDESIVFPENQGKVTRLPKSVMHSITSSSNFDKAIKVLSNSKSKLNQ